MNTIEVIKQIVMSRIDIDVKTSVEDNCGIIYLKDVFGLFIHLISFCHFQRNLFNNDNMWRLMKYFFSICNICFTQFVTRNVAIATKMITRFVMTCFNSSAIIPLTSLVLLQLR